jgi:hypothetical protein
MPRTLDLSEPLSEEIEQEARREGVSPADHAALLLYIVTALHETGKAATPFQQAVRVFLSSRSVDAEQISTVLDELVQFCLTAPTGAGKSGAALQMSAENQAGNAIYALPAYRPLAQWRNAFVHSPPLDTMTRATGRRNRSAEETKPVETKEEPVDAPGWPGSFFEETFGSLADDPIARLPQGGYERREPLT